MDTGSKTQFSRKDGRGGTDMRTVEIQIGPLPNADGSGAFSFGLSEVRLQHDHSAECLRVGTEAAIASFAGPLEPPTARMDVFTEAVLAVNHRPLEGSAGACSSYRCAPS